MPPVRDILPLAHCMQGTVTVNTTFVCYSTDILTTNSLSVIAKVRHANGEEKYKQIWQYITHRHRVLQVLLRIYYELSHPMRGLSFRVYLSGTEKINPVSILCKYETDNCDCQ